MWKIIIGILDVGVMLAMIISWSVNHSILWALLHGLGTWGYVIYFALT